MNRRLLAVIMSFAVVFSMCCSFAFASESDSTEEVDVVCVDSAGDMNKVSESADVVVLEDAELYEEIDSGVIEENLDNGTVIVVDNIGEEQTEEVCDIFDIDLEEENLQENDAVKAVYVKADGAGGYSSTPVVASIEPLDGMEIDDEELDRALDDAVEEDVFDVESLYNNFDADKNAIQIMSNVQNDSNGTLQSSEPTGESFIDESKTFVLYGCRGASGYVGNNKSDAKSSKGDKGDEYEKGEQPNRWVKISETNIMAWAYKKRTSNNDTYDYIIGKVHVNPTGKFKVIQYNFKLTHGDSDRYKITDYEVIHDSEEIIEVSLGTGGFNVSYSYNLKDQQVDNESCKQGRLWRCKPLKSTRGAEYMIEPYIVLKSTDGKQKNTYAYAVLSYQKFKSFKYGEISNDDDRKITMRFKNHSET